MKVHPVFLFVLVVFFSFPGFIVSQDQKMVLPYEMVSGKMIVKLLLNGNEERFMFDTGAGTSALTFDYVEEKGLHFADSMKVKDVTSQTIAYNQTVIESITDTSQRIVFKNLKAIVLPKTFPLHCYDAVGIIGSDLLAKTQCLINPEDKTITIALSNRINSEFMRYSHNFTSKGNLPIFQMQLNGEFVEALFDSGSSSFINLKYSDYATLNEKGLVTTLEQGFGTGSIGSSGIQLVDSSYRVQLPIVRLGPMKINGVITETENAPFSLVGTKLLDYARVIIDYPRRMIFIVPLKDEPVQPESKLPNFGVTIKDGRMVICQLWTKSPQNLSLDDVITHVDGKPTGKYDICDIVGGIEMMKGDKPKTLTIQTKDGTIIEEIYKLEIINQ